jgi:transcriptional regulator with XRE-family HTH domain
MALEDDAEWLRRSELNSLMRACRARMVRPLQVPDRRGPRMLSQVRGGRGRGARQQDVAELADVSARYYSDIERGVVTMSAALVDQIAAALQMTDAERSALHVLASGQDPPRPVSRALHVPPPEPSAPLRDIVNQQGFYPSALTDEMWTLKYHNESLSAWSGGWYDRADPAGRNMLLFLFSGEARQWLPDIEALQRYSLAALRYQFDRNLASPRAAELVARLLTIPEAARMWRDHEIVIPPHEYPVRIRHPKEGILDAHIVLTPLHPELWLYIMRLPAGTAPPGMDGPGSMSSPLAVPA